MIRFFLLMTLLFIGCATPPIDPGSLRIREISHGLYADRGGKAEFTQTTEQVPCALGTLFGATINVSFPKGSRSLPLAAEWNLPEVDGSPSGVDTFIDGPLPIPRNATAFDLDAVYELETAQELVNGDYQLRFYNPRGGDVYYTHTFVVQGCE